MEILMMVCMMGNCDDGAYDVNDCKNDIPENGNDRIILISHA